MQFKNLIFKMEEGIALLQINRPQVLNALNTETLKELEEVIDYVAGNSEIKVLIITGVGRAFVAGADISEMVNFSPFLAKDFAERGHRILTKIENLPQVVIAGINGFALGGGCEIALACDIRIMAEGAKIGQPEVNLGIIPGFGGCLRLPRVVGKGMAEELIFTGEMIDANEALRIGLVNRIVPSEKLLDSCQEVAHKIVGKVSETIALAKKTIKLGLETDLETAKDLEIQAFSLLFSLSEPKERMKAFLNKSKR